MGGIEILYDLTSDVDYKYMYQGEQMLIKIQFMVIFKTKFKNIYLGLKLYT